MGPFMLMDWPTPRARRDIVARRGWYVNLLESTLSISAAGVNSTARLTAAVLAVCPIVTLSIGVEGQSTSVQITFSASATPSQQIAAQVVVEAFDWSGTAGTSYEALQLRAAALARLVDPAAEFKLIRGVLAVLLDDINVLRTNDGLTTRTLTEVKALVSSKIDSGLVDT